MATKERVELKTVNDLIRANENLYNKHISGELDAKNLDAANTIIKSQSYLVGKLRMDYAKLVLLAQTKKLNMPDDVLPRLLVEGK
jgi:hypothetical protein